MTTFKTSALAVAVSLAVAGVAGPALAKEKALNSVQNARSVLSAVTDYAETGNRSGWQGVVQAGSSGVAGTDGNGRQTAGSTIPRSGYYAPSLFTR